MRECYKDTGYCGVCKKTTEQILYCDGHERDSSHDWQLCLECRHEYCHMTGKWWPNTPESFANTVNLFESGYYAQK